MKQILMIIVMTVALGALMAHPAGNVKPTFDKGSSLLSVSFAHKVRDAADHFINHVEIKVNGKDAIVHKLSLQESLEGGTLIYKLPALKKGDKINVLTKCNKGGDKSSTITVP